MKAKHNLLQICLLCAALVPAYGQINTFKAAMTLNGSGAPTPPAPVIAVDLNGDGKLDLIGAGTVFTNNGKGAFSAFQFNPPDIRSNSFVAADADHDGKLDLIILTNQTVPPFAESIVVYTNGGNRSSFQYPYGFTLGFHSSTTNVGQETVVTKGALGNAGDVYGNGRTNLFYYNHISSTVSLFTNDGTGVFGSNTTFGVRMGLPVTADVNRDGKIDFISPGYTNDLVYVFTNDGGAFGSNAAFGINAPTNVFTADVNADGWVDLIVLSVTNYAGADNMPVSRLSVWTNNGSGIFGSNTSFTVGDRGQRVNDLKVAPLFGDANVHLAMAVNDVYYGKTYLMVYTNNGSGRFGSNFITANLSAGGFTNPVSLTVADVSGDGNLDLISANNTSSSGTISVFTNTGNGIQSGSFLSNSIPVVGTNAYFVLAADLYRKGQPQLITYASIYYQNFGLLPAFLVLTNNGSGRFGSNAVIKEIVPANSFYLRAPPIAADLFGTGYPALIYGLENYNGSPGLMIMTNNGSGSFRTNAFYRTILSPVYYSPITPYAIVAADVNGDGKLDLVAAGLGQYPGLIVLTNNGAGGFSNNVVFTLNSVSGSYAQLAVADINADGRPDLLAATIGYANGIGLTSQLEVFTNISPAGVGPLYSVDNSTASYTYPITPGANPSAIVAADVNGDGNPDVIIANNNNPGTLSVMLNKGFNNAFKSYTFALASSPVVGAHPHAVTAADVNGDGKIDLISANWGPVTNASDPRAPLGYGTLSILTNNGSGGFTNPATFSTDPGPNAVIALDVNKDGRPDLISANFTSFTNTRAVPFVYGEGHTLSILLNTSNFVNTVALQTAPDNAPITYGQTFLSGGAVTNLNGVAVNGAFTFANGVPPAGTANYPVTFSATPPTDYQPITFNISITVNQLVAILKGIRAYDGTTNVAFTSLSVSNKVGIDDVIVSAGSVGMDTANIGTNPITSTNGLVLGGSTAGNYTLAGVSGSVIVTQAVNLPAITSTLNPAGYHAVVNFAATMPAFASGTIQFLTNDLLFDTQGLSNGVAGSMGTAGLPLGANSIAAIYSGDANNAPTTNYLSQLVLPPQFNTITPGTGGLIMSGSLGSSNATFYLLASTNLTLPISQWTPVLTNQFDNNGNYIFTNPISVVPEAYYMLELP